MSFRDDLRKVLGLKDTAPNMTIKPPVLGGVGLSRTTIPSGQREDDEPECYPALTFDDAGAPLGKYGAVIDGLYEKNSGRRVRIILSKNITPCADAAESEDGFFILKNLCRYTVDAMPDDFWSDSGMHAKYSLFGFLQWGQGQDFSKKHWGAAGLPQNFWNETVIWHEAQRNFLRVDYNNPDVDEPAGALGFEFSEKKELDVMYASTKPLNDESNFEEKAKATVELRDFLFNHSDKADTAPGTCNFMYAHMRGAAGWFNQQATQDGNAGIWGFDGGYYDYKDGLTTEPIEIALGENWPPYKVLNSTRFDGPRTVNLSYLQQQGYSSRPAWYINNGYPVKEIPDISIIQSAWLTYNGIKTFYGFAKPIDGAKIEVTYPDGTRSYSEPERWAACRLVADYPKYKDLNPRKKCFAIVMKPGFYTPPSIENHCIAHSLARISSVKFHGIDGYEPSIWELPPNYELSIMTKVVGNFVFKPVNKVEMYLYEFDSYFDKSVIDLIYDVDTGKFEARHPHDNTFLPQMLNHLAGELKLKDNDDNAYALAKNDNGFTLTTPSNNYFINDKKIYEVSKV